MRIARASMRFAIAFVALILALNGLFAHDRGPSINSNSSNTGTSSSSSPGWFFLPSGGSGTSGGSDWTSSGSGDGSSWDSGSSDDSGSWDSGGDSGSWDSGDDGSDSGSW